MRIPIMCLFSLLPACATSSDPVEVTDQAFTTTSQLLYDQVMARPIYRATVSLAAGARPHVFSTLNLAGASPDTYLVVSHAASVWSNDDCAATSRASCATTTVEAGAYTITVFASHPGGWGTTDVAVDGIALAHQVAFGGQLVPLKVAAGPTYTLQTVLQPAGATDTVVVLYDAGWHELGYDDDGGVARASRLVAQVPAGSMLLVAAKTAAAAGLTRVIADTCNPAKGCSAGIDSDGDGLSDALEAQLGTSAALRDTDADGVDDYLETIGSDGLPLPSYGGSATRRDLYLEIDRADGAAHVPTEALIAGVQEVYADLPEIVNPDGSIGIFVHADIGAACTNPTLCGDWGGATAIDSYFSTPGATSRELYPGSGLAASGNFATARWGAFHYVSSHACGLSQGGLGKATVKLCYADRAQLGHELGHNLGLEHWGSPADPLATAMNSKGAYPSIMNYAYTYGLPPLDHPRFSEGLLPSIDYHSLDEVSWAPGLDKQHLAFDPYFYAVAGDSIDWDRDGRTHATPVMADVTPVNYPVTGAGWPELTGWTTVNTAMPTGGSGLVARALDADGATAELVAFTPFAHADGTYPDFATRTDTLGGAAATWSAWRTGPRLAGRSDGEAAAALLPDWAGLGPTATVVFPNADGHLFYNLYPVDHDWWWYWSPIAAWPAGVSARNATVALVGGRVVVLFRDVAAAEGVDNVWESEMDASGVWTPWHLLHLASYFTPGLVEGPDGNAYLAYGEYTTTATGFSVTTKLASRPTGSTGDFTPIAGTWAAARVSAPGLAAVERARLNLLFLPFREASGAPFTDGSGHLALMWNNGGMDSEDSWRLYRAYFPGWLEPSGPHLAGGEAKWHSQAMIDRPYLTHSVAVTRRQHDAAQLYTSTVWTSGAGPYAAKAPIYMPYANGTPPASTGRNTDWNDNTTIRATLCASVRSFTGAACP
jgi:hypothetical protein